MTPWSSVEVAPLSGQLRSVQVVPRDLARPASGWRGGVRDEDGAVRRTTAGRHDRVGDARDDHGRRATRGGAVAELAVEVVTPRLHGAVGERDDAHVATGADRDRVADVEHVDRRTALRGGAVTELVTVVATPRHDRAVGPQGVGVVRAGRNVGHGARDGDRDRLETVGDGAVADLAVVVLAPGPDGAVVEYGDRVVATAGEALHVREARATDPHRREPPGRGAVTELPSSLRPQPQTCPPGRIA